MAEKISIEIGLDGGAEVERQLADIGKSGQQAFGDIQAAADQVNFESTTEQFDNLGTAGQAAFQKVQAAAKNAVVFEQIIQGVKKVEGAFDSLGTAVERMATRMTKSLGMLGVLARSLGPVGIAVGAAAGAFVKFGDSAADALNKLTPAGAKLGLTAQQLDAFEQSLGKLGVSSDAVIPGLEKLSETWGGNLFRSIETFIGQLERMPDSVRRTQLAIETLGEALGGQVIAGLQTGAISAGKFAEALTGVAPATQEQIVQAAKYQQALNQMSAAWEQFKAQVIAPIATPVFQFLTAEINALRIDLKGLIIDIQATWNTLKALRDLFAAPPAEQQAAAERVAKSFRQIGTGAQQAAQQSKQGVDTTTQAVLQLGQTTAQTGPQVATGLFNLTQATDASTQSMRLLGQQGLISGVLIQEGMNTAAQAAGNTTVAVDQLTQAFSRLGIEAAMWSRAAFGGGIEAQMWNQPRRGFASGGIIGGRGTGTSDSNLAWVSRGEHIMPARAVAQPGVLSFLESLRRSGGNLRSVLDDIGRFALGGLVPRPTAAFAAGGPVGGMSNVTIQFPGLQPIGGLRASSSVVEELHRAAALAQVRSGGRKPSRYS